MSGEKVCFVDDRLRVELSQQGVESFTVTYGKQVKEYLSYSQAARALGVCMMHALACLGELDNSEMPEDTNLYGVGR